MQEKIKAAAMRLLIHKGYEILDDDYDSLIVTLDDDTIVFLDLIVIDAESGFKDTDLSREEFESAAINWLIVNHNPTDKAIRFDTMCFIPVSEDNVILRHEIKRW